MLHCFVRGWRANEMSVVDALHEWRHEHNRIIIQRIRKTYTEFEFGKQCRRSKWMSTKRTTKYQQRNRKDKAAAKNLRPPACTHHHYRHTIVCIVTKLSIQAIYNSELAHWQEYTPQKNAWNDTAHTNARATQAKNGGGGQKLHKSVSPIEYSMRYYRTTGWDPCASADRFAAYVNIHNALQSDVSPIAELRRKCNGQQFNWTKLIQDWNCTKWKTYTCRWDMRIERIVQGTNLGKRISLCVRVVGDVSIPRSCSTMHL